MPNENVKYIISMQDKMSGKIDNLNKKTSTLDSRMGGLNKSLKMVGATALTYFGGRAILRGFTDLVQSGMEFSSGMANVQAITGATGEDFKGLTNLAQKLGETTQFSARQASEGMSFLAMAGFKTKDIISAMPGVLNLAAVGSLSLAEASDIASNALTAYGLEAKEIGRVNDMIAKTITSANTDTRQFAEAFKYVAPVAKGAGVQMEELSAAIGILGNAGIQGSMAGTSLRQSIAQIITPAGQKKMQKFGIDVMDATGNMLPLVDIVAQMEKQGLKTADIMGIFGMRAGPGMQVLVNQGADALRGFTKELNNAAGTADRIARVKLDNLKGDTIKLKSAFEGLQINLEKRMDPALRESTQGVTSMIGAMSKWAKLKVSDEIRREQQEVNRLAASLSNSYISQEERLLIYEKLKMVAPDVVKGIDADNISTGQLNIKLREYNELQRKKLTFALLEEKQVKVLNAETKAHSNLVDKQTQAINKANEKGIDLVTTQQLQAGQYKTALWMLRKQAQETEKLIEKGKESGEISKIYTDQELDPLRQKLWHTNELINRTKGLIKAEENYTDKSKLADKAREQIALNKKLLGLMTDGDVISKKQTELETTITGADKVEGAITKITSAAPKVLETTITGADKVEGAITKITSAAPKVFNINIDRQIGIENLTTETLQEGITATGESALNVLIQALNQSQIIAGE